MKTIISHGKEDIFSCSTDNLRYLILPGFCPVVVKWEDLFISADWFRINYLVTVSLKVEL